MKITFVQNDKEKAESDRVIRAGLSLRKAKVGTWILPPSLSKDNKFVVVDGESLLDLTPNVKLVSPEPTMLNGTFATLTGTGFIQLLVKPPAPDKEN